MTKFGLADTRGPRSIQENRKAQRAPVALKGKIFLPEHSIEESCEIVDFSAGGAGLKCSAFAAVGRKIVLYADCFGRFDGVVVQRNRTRLGIAFQISTARKKRTGDQIAAYVANGMASYPSLRSSLQTNDLPALQCFVGADGCVIVCEFVDIGLRGALLRTGVRPEVGEIVYFGETRGRVVRHTRDGIAIDFATGNH